MIASARCAASIASRKVCRPHIHTVRDQHDRLAPNFALQLLIRRKIHRVVQDCAARFRRPSAPDRDRTANRRILAQISSPFAASTPNSSNPAAIPLRSEADQERHVLLSQHLARKTRAACFSTPIRLRWLPLTSTSRPSVRGRSVSRVKYLIVCCLPVFENGEVVLLEVADQRRPSCHEPKTAR